MRATLRMVTPKQIGGPKPSQIVTTVEEKESDEESFCSSDDEITLPTKTKSIDKQHIYNTPTSLTSPTSKPSTGKSTSPFNVSLASKPSTGGGGVGPLNPAPNESQEDFNAMSDQEKKKNSYVYYEVVKPHKVKSVR